MLCRVIALAAVLALLVSPAWAGQEVSPAKEALPISDAQLSDRRYRLCCSASQALNILALRQGLISSWLHPCVSGKLKCT